MPHGHNNIENRDDAYIKRRVLVSESKNYNTGHKTSLSIAQPVINSILPDLFLDRTLALGYPIDSP